MFKKNNSSPTFVAIGECMLELIPHTDHLLKKSYAGDVYNALVYAKRCFNNIDCGFFTGVGKDVMSRDMLCRWQQEGLNLAYTQDSDTHSLGIYAISVDNEGERSFSYWRKDSAATQLMEYKSQEQLLELFEPVDLVFFSGIVVGILANEDKLKLFELIDTLKTQGKVIAFDPNYRPTMFSSHQDAAAWMTKAYQVSDIALPGLDEHQVIYQHQNVDDVVDFCLAQGVKEVVVKAGKAGTYVASVSEPMIHQGFVPAPKQVDSTAAGDSFAGAYLGSRLNNLSPEFALLNANKVAAEVVQHQGAILSQQIFQQRLNQVLIK